jgi:DNA mismatch repair protein MutL
VPGASGWGGAGFAFRDWFVSGGFRDWFERSAASAAPRGVGIDDAESGVGEVVDVVERAAGQVGCGLGIEENLSARVSDDAIPGFRGLDFHDVLEAGAAAAGDTQPESGSFFRMLSEDLAQLGHGGGSQADHDGTEEVGLDGKWSGGQGPFLSFLTEIKRFSCLAMQKIKVMSEVLASQVAAGEVVERPASVVRELVENSIDAGAGRIDVLVRRGGTALIRVVDDGVGMGRDDALLCVERHATSKIRTSGDLAAIRTMGFRGEALPSIASVARFVLKTREREALHGTEVVVDGGQLVAVSDAGEAPGTQVEVRSLFYNVPARRKFLRAEATEFSHIEQQVRVHALAYPELAFSLTHDERLVFQLPGGSGLLERIRGLAGVEVAERLREIPETTEAGITVQGFLGEPGTSRSNRSLCYCFLNRRPVESAVFTMALRGAYGEALPRGQWPVAFLFIGIDPGEVDVNVHPAKREVRFRSSQAVQAALTSVCAAALQGRRAVPVPEPVPVVVPVARWVVPPEQRTLIPEPEQRALRHDWSDFPAAAVAAAAVAAGGGEGAPVEPAKAVAAVRKPAEVPFRMLSRLGDVYWLMEGEEGLVVLDCRAARERILYEEARARRSGEPLAGQILLSPITLQLAPREFDLLRPHLPALRRMGVGASEFGANTVMVDSLPPFWEADGSTAERISGLLADLREAGEPLTLRRLDDDAVAAAVARQAAKIPVPSDAAEARALVSSLLSCEMPYCCPDGNPTLIQISFQELARKFGRR